jgi:hypothetical protein
MLINILENKVTSSEFHKVNDKETHQGSDSVVGQRVVPKKRKTLQQNRNYLKKPQGVYITTYNTPVVGGFKTN